MTIEFTKHKNPTEKGIRGLGRGFHISAAILGESSHGGGFTLRIINSGISEKHDALL